MCVGRLSSPFWFLYLRCVDCRVMLHTGRHFLQIPGPTNVPDRVLRAMDHPVIDHRGPEFAALTHEVLEGLRPVFKTSGPVIIFPSSGHRRRRSGARQHVVAGRSRADLRDRPFLAGLARRSRNGWAWRSTTCRATGAVARPNASSRSRLWRRRAAHLQGRRRRPQRDVDRRDQPARRTSRRR